MKNENVLGIDLLQTRIFGNKIYAEAVHDEIEQNFPKVKHIMVHVNPAKWVTVCLFGQNLS